MRKLPIHCALAAISTISAAVPNSFSPGRPVIAQDVNTNFSALDTAIQNRATKAELADKVAAKSLNDTAAAIRKAIPVVNISGKADSVWVAKQVGAKADTSKLSVLGTQLSALQTTTNTIGASYLPKSSVTGSAGTIPKFGDGSTLENSSITEAGNGSVSFGGGPGWIGGAISTSSADNGAAWTVSNPSQSWSFQIRGDGHNGSAVNAWAIQDETKNTVRVWGDATGVKVLTPLAVQGDFSADSISASKLVVASMEGTTTNLPGHYFTNLYSNDGTNGRAYVHYYPFGTRNNTTLRTFANLRVKNGNPSNDKGEDVNVLILGGDGLLKWVVGGQATTVAHSGNLEQMGVMLAKGGTITGDLRISGKLTTPPGATPADYVFEPDYQLMSLSEVEAFTKANKHLPEVPSAAEMTSKGVDVAAMNMVLLKKVEELTLHAIALQKALEAQKSQFEQRLQRLESTSR